MLSDGPWQRRRMSPDALNRGSDVPAEQLVLQTKNIVEPGRYSQRSTALPFNDRELKLPLPMSTDGRGPAPSGSATYWAIAPDVHDTARLASLRHASVDAPVRP